MLWDLQATIANVGNLLAGHDFGDQKVSFVMAANKEMESENSKETGKDSQLTLGPRRLGIHRFM